VASYRGEGGRTPARTRAIWALIAAAAVAYMGLAACGARTELLTYAGPEAGIVHGAEDAGIAADARFDSKQADAADAQLDGTVRDAADRDAPGRDVSVNRRDVGVDGAEVGSDAADASIDTDGTAADAGCGVAPLGGLEVPPWFTRVCPDAGCPADTVCISVFGPLGTQQAGCAPIPARCAEQSTCACMGCVCGPQGCADSDGGIVCQSRTP